DVNRHARALITRALYTLETAPPGQRHYALRRAACTLGGVMHAAGFTEAEAAQHLLDAAARAGAEDMRNAASTVASGLAWGAARPMELGR
ncbi:hypothetical protein, partial [Acidisphaera rubrifaciens]|uniref:hypothetical protein n=1 Tax=Acidisphaera rubrifaciens TaxID=50715 RepID=UPI000662033B